MFSSLLIANRGEISRRIQRTARKLGVRTVAVFSDADSEAAFVREADESVWIGAAAAAESYLKGDRIIEAALKTGAEAIHPGYGFLSENAGFAEAVGKAGLIWIGPPPEAIRAMGLKDAAKALMEKHGVPVTPGYHGEDQSPKTLKAAAKRIGYPVLIKAIAGGGGRGMRRVDADKDFDAALTSAQREAKASFGDDRVLVEKFIENPRHIEVQVFGDSHDNYVHFFERDCSLQRRRQKVIEEAPAPGMTDAVRKAMTDAALLAAKAVGYRNAGTVEFIVDGSGALRPDGFWFMEMNTRLQVEHPVTEMITGRDLVELQFHVATGGKLPEQSEIVLNGHAVEARLCAEDPANGFLPSSGKLELFDVGTYEPSDDNVTKIRFDGAVESNDFVPSSYDSMIAKAIVHAPTREQAFARASKWMRNIQAWPLATNAAFLGNLFSNSVVLAGRATTALVETELHALAQAGEEEIDTALTYGAIGVALLEQATKGGKDPWSVADGFRINGAPQIATVFETLSGIRMVRLVDHKVTTLWGDRFFGFSGQADVNGRMVGYETKAHIMERDRHVSFRDGHRHVAEVRKLAADTVVFMNGRAIALRRPEYGHALEGLAAGDEVRAPMPGKILEVKAKAGASVKRGDPLVIMEAMKMEHTLAAPRDGVLAEVAAKAGAQVAEGTVLAKLEPLPE